MVAEIMIKVVILLLTVSLAAWYIGLFFGPVKYRPPGCESMSDWKYAKLTFEICKFVCFFGVLIALLIFGGALAIMF